MFTGGSKAKYSGNIGDVIVASVRKAQLGGSTAVKKGEEVVKGWYYRPHANEASVATDARDDFD